MVRVVEMYKSKFQLEEREVFDLLIFDLDGGIRLQTNKKVYLFCTAYFYAALDLSRLLNGEQPKHCDYGSDDVITDPDACLLYTSPSPRDQRGSRMPSSA